MKNWYRGAELPQKEGLGQFTNLRGWLGKKEGDGAFEGRGEWYPDENYAYLNLSSFWMLYTTVNALIRIFNILLI